MFAFHYLPINFETRSRRPESVSPFSSAIEWLQYERKEVVLGLEAISSPSLCPEGNWGSFLGENAAEA
jgi:hypothetical protein